MKRIIKLLQLLKKCDIIIKNKDSGIIFAKNLQFLHLCHTYKKTQMRVKYAKYKVYSSRYRFQ